MQLFRTLLLVLSVGAVSAGHPRRLRGEAPAVADNTEAGDKLSVPEPLAFNSTLNMMSLQEECMFKGCEVNNDDRPDLSHPGEGVTAGGGGR